MAKKESETKLLASLRDLSQKRTELRNSLTLMWPKQVCTFLKVFSWTLKCIIYPRYVLSYDSHPTCIEKHLIEAAGLLSGICFEENTGS